MNNSEAERTIAKKVAVLYKVREVGLESLAARVDFPPFVQREINQTLYTVREDKQKWNKRHGTQA